MRSNEGERGAVKLNESLSSEKGKPVASHVPCSNLNSTHSAVIVTCLSDFFERLTAPRRSFDARPAAVAS